MTACQAIDNPTVSILPTQCDDVVVEELDGEAVLYNPQTGAVHHFNNTMFFVWNACDGSHTTDGIAAAMVKRFAVSLGDALEMVEGLVEQLVQMNLLYDRAAKTKHVVSCRSLDTCPAGQGGHRGLSRRELLEGGITKAMLAAPVISTFFASGAYASGPSASAAFGTGGCKNIGYSCGTSMDCCPDALSGCVSGTCLG